MDSRTRVEAALALDVADRPPAAWWAHTFVEEWSPADLAAVTAERARRFQWDFVKFQPRASCFAESFGAEYKPSGNAQEAPSATGPAVQSPEDWRNLAQVSPHILEEQASALGMVASELGPSVPVIQTVFSPLSVANYLVGRDKKLAVQQLREMPEEVGPALDKIGSALIDFAAASILAGAAGVFYAISGYAASDMMSEQEYRELALALDRRVIGSLPEESWFNVLHLCGANLHFNLAEELRADAVSWSVHDSGNPSLSEGRDRTGKAVMGGLGQMTTLLSSTQAVQEEGRRAVDETGGRGLLLAPGCSVPVDAPEPNLAAIAGVFP